MAAQGVIRFHVHMARVRRKREGNVQNPGNVELFGGVGEGCAKPFKCDDWVEKKKEAFKT